MAYSPFAINQQDNDIYITGNQLTTVRDSLAIGQHARQRLQTYHGEWWLNVNVGVQWIDHILGKKYNPALLEAIVKRTVLDTPGVTSIIKFSVRFNRDLRGIEAFDIQVLTTFDEVINI